MVITDIKRDAMGTLTRLILKVLSSVLYASIIGKQVLNILAD